MAPSLEIDYFVNALRQFFARCGQVLEIQLDNGTNFIGEEHELRETIMGWNQAHTNDTLLQKEIKVVSNPLAGSHNGGTLEY